LCAEFDLYGDGDWVADGNVDDHEQRTEQSGPGTAKWQRVLGE
jgi:hypothetical protein